MIMIQEAFGMALQSFAAAPLHGENEMRAGKMTDIRTGVFHVLDNHNFCIFLAAQIVSVLGMWMQVTALGWLIYRLSASAYAVATLVFLNQIPVLILSPWAGMLADRFYRRKLLVFTQSASFVLTLLLAIVALQKDPKIPWLLLLVSGGGIVYALDLPARQSFLCDLVGPSQVRYAIILNSLSFHLARMTGPLLAGILVIRAREGWCIVLNAVSFFVVIAALVMICETQPSAGSRAQRTGLMEGFGHVWNHPELLRPLLLLSLISLLGAQHSTFMPVLVKQNMNGGAGILGILMGAPGIGALTAGLLLLFRPAYVRGSFLLPAMTVGVGIAIMILAWTTRVWLAETLLVLLGFCITFQNAGSNILLQERAPEKIRGRVMALFSMSFMGLMPLGAFLLGFATRHTGVSAALTVAGMICAVSALAMELGFRTKKLAMAAR
jgi:MFS family permease